MVLKPAQPFYRRKPFLVFVSGTICSLVLIFAMRLWKADVNYLFVGSGGDSVLELLGIQNMLETGTRNLSSRLGGIGGQQLYDYPVADALNYGIMRIISLFTQNPAAIMNLFFLITFPLAAMTAMLALLKLGFSRIVSLFASLLYPFMSYHFLRNQNHLLLSAYYMVPLGILVILWVMTGECSVTFSRRKSFRENIRENRRFLACALICLVISSTGLYYAYFTCLFLLLAIVKISFHQRKWNRYSTAGLIFIGLISLGVLANYTPTVLYHLSGGERAAALIRPGESAELYGLKLIDLFIPTVGHRVGFIRHLVSVFHNSEPVSNENSTVSLGALGSIGFGILLLVPVIKFKIDTQRIKIMKNTSFLAIAAVLLAAQGGVSALICRLFFSSIRAYNRISVFLFFFGLISIAVLIDALIWGRMPAAKISSDNLPVIRKGRFSSLRQFFAKHRKWLCLLLAPLLLLALFDQTPTNSVLPYDANRRSDRQTQVYFQEVESSVPSGSYIYQLPFVEFPEPSVSYGASPYSQLFGYLNTKTLHWSYGAMTGTKSSNWAKSVSRLSPSKMIAALKEAGYSGIYIDLHNYPDESLAKQKEELAALAGSLPIVSKDGEKVFIKI